MSSFNARLRLPGQSKLPLAVEVDIHNERMTLTSGHRTLADWPLSTLDIHGEADGFHIAVDGDEVVLSVSEPARFAALLGISVKSRASAPIPSARTERPNGQRVEPHGAQPYGSGTTLQPAARVPADDAHQDLAQRISAISAALNSTSVSPAEAFGRWLRLLKEVNRRHGQGSMTCDQFYRLNTRMLDLIPEPGPPPPSPGS